MNLCYDFENIKANFRSKAAFTDEELDMICNRLVVKNIKKKKTLLAEGNIPQYVIYINSGILQMYSAGLNGTDVTFEICTENSWIADLEAFYKRSSASASIEVIEEAQVFMLHYDDVLALHKQIPSLLQFSKLHAEEKYNAAVKRLQAISHPGLTAERRIAHFNDCYPDLIKRIPSYIVASYLGISPETLSRIKSQSSKIDIYQEKQ